MAENFTFENAQALMPEVKRLTTHAVGVVEGMVSDVNDLNPEDARRQRVAEEIRGVIENWVRDITALGAEVKGLWLVDFDSGEGYYCWKHPEETLEYFHGYEDGFAGRRLIRPETLH